MADEDELEELVRYYFSRNYDHRTIPRFLEKILWSKDIQKRAAGPLVKLSPFTKRFPTPSG